MLVQPGFEPATSRSADRRSPNWANQAAVNSSSSANSWISSSSDLSAECSFELEPSVLFSLKLASTTCKVRVMFLLKTAFSSSHSRGSRWRPVTYFPVNSASIVAMLVKLLLVLIASNTSPASSLEVSFSRSKYALCCKRFSFNFPTFLLLSFFLRDCRSFPVRDENFRFRFISVVASLFEASWRFSWSTFTRSWASWKYFSSSLAERVFEYGLLYKLRNERGKRQNGHTRTLNATPLRVARSKN